MAAITITAANVVKGADAVVSNGIGGATITAGQTVYLDAADGKFKLFDADSGTVAARSLVGIALNGCADGQPLAIQTGGDITIGGTVVKGTVYVGGATAGAINPAADLVSGWYVNIVGVATSASVVRLAIRDFATVV